MEAGSWFLVLGSVLSASVLDEDLVGGIQGIAGDPLQDSGVEVFSAESVAELACDVGDFITQNIEGQTRVRRPGPRSQAAGRASQ